MRDAIREADRAVALPARGLIPLIHRYVGYRYAGMNPGIHRGLPSPSLTLIISLDRPMRIAEMPHPAQPPGEFTALVGGFHTRPATIAHGRQLAGIQIDLTPAGVRSLLGCPTGELGPLVLNLEDVMGPAGRELVDRVTAAPDWESRFDVLNSLLLRRVGRVAEADATLTNAWSMIVQHAGNVTVNEIARAVGWSRRHLSARFAREYGVTVKEAARIARFHRSRLLLQNRHGLTIAEAAAATGYYDQAHMAREWRQLAGCPPSIWLDTEELPFVQDGPGTDAGH